MDIKHIKIRHFRGIRCLDWIVDGRFICLIGPGDSTKSTILEAIELSLTPRRNVVFDDVDFYNADTNNSIHIEVTVGEVPIDLLSEAKFGYLIKGWNNEMGVRDEPQENDEPVLTIQLIVEKTLEPTWLVVNDREPEGKRISAFDRVKFGISRIGDYVDWQLSWGQGSALTRLMEEREDVRSFLADARRRAKASLNPEDLPLLKQSAKNAESIGNNLGVAARSKTGFMPHLDIRSVSIGASILTLHDGPIPLRQAGLGTSRLLTMGLQHEASRRGGIMLIDEIENGLEPHRLRRLLHVLRTGTRLQKGHDKDKVDEDTTANQVFLTTHSSVALCELEPVNLRIVHSENGATDIKRPDNILRPLFRTNPDSFLARKIIVCEGKTEIGFCRALDAWWSETGRSFAYIGAVLANGQGNTNGPAAAISFANLGYQTAFFGDSDQPLSPDEKLLNSAGVCPIVWAGGVSIEERIALDLSWEGFIAMAQLAIEEFGEDHVQAKLAAQFKCQPDDLSADPEIWASRFGEASVRLHFAKAAKAKKAEWFKRIDRAEKLGNIVIIYWDKLSAKPLGSGIAQIKDWVYD